MKRQFTIRAIGIAVSCVCLYLALAARYGFGRGLVCLAVLLQGATSILFFVTSYHSLQEEHQRNALAALILGLLILGGAILLGLIVFQLPQKPTDPFASSAAQVTTIVLAQNEISPLLFS